MCAQACYGHTEGAAGVTGILMAVCSLQQSIAPGVMGLRSINPYVGAALQEWPAPHDGAANSPLVPRETMPGVSLHLPGQTALAGLYPIAGPWPSS